MATRKKSNPDATAAAAAPAAAQAPAPSAFSSIVSGAGLAMKTQARFDQARATEGLGKPTDNQNAAWAAICSPSALLGMAIFEHYDHWGQRHSGNPLNTLGGWIRSAAGPTLADKLPLLAAGISDLASDIDRAARSKAFVDSGADHGRLIAAPAAGGGLAYPAFGLALTDKSNVMLEGKRARSVVAVKLGAHGSFPWVAPEDRPQAARSWNQASAVQKIEELNRAAGDLPDPDRARAELESASAASARVEKFLTDRDNRSVVLFSAILDERNGSIHLNGESPLPSVAAFERSALADQASRNDRRYYRDSTFGFASAPRAQYIDTLAPAAANAFQQVSWKWALSSALAPEASGKLSGLDRAQRLGLKPDLFAQARFGPWDKQGQERLNDAKSMENAWKLLVEKKWAKNTDDHGRNRYNDRKWADLAAHLAEATAKPDAEELSTRMEIAAVFSQANFGTLGTGLEGMGKFLSGEDPRVGLAQLAETLLSWKQNISRYSDSDEATISTGSPQLDQALSSYADSLSRAQSAFTASALQAARKTESDWFAAKNLLSAWRQALASGKPTSKSVAWAAANPVEEILESGEPIDRLAARSARGLGLAAKSGALALRESLYAEYAEMGAAKSTVDRLAEQPKLAERLARLAGALTEADRKLAHASQQALRFSALAIESAVEMPAERAENFAMAYVGSSLACFTNGSGYPDALFDGMGPDLSPVGITSRKSAEILAELAEAKREGYPQFIKALAADWNQTCQSALARGLAEEPAQALAADRAREIVSLFQNGSKLDWRARPFAEGRAAWEIFGMPSPRLTAALADARANGGSLGAWCADRARALGIADAADGNDLIAKTREAAKALCGLTDGAWKLAIKDEESLKALSAAMGVDPHNTRYGNDKKASASFAPQFRLADGPALDMANRFGPERPAAQYNPMTSAGMALSAAASGGIAPKTAASALAILSGTGARSGKGSYYSLFGDGTLPATAEGADGARFFIAEDDAKKSRAPKIFLEICKRLDKLTADAAKPPKEGQAPIVPAQRLAEELSDLSDWIKGSEHGIWQTLPQEPTLGQLSRLSKAWHDETAAAARDKQERKTIAEQRKEEREAAREEEIRMARQAEEAERMRQQRELANRGVPADRQAAAPQAAAPRAAARPAANPFAAGSGAKWSKIIGKHAREGWEAVELLSAAELSEEGTAMNHCVSSYSMQCREGSCRIFSIRLNGERKCTLEIRGPGKLADLNEFAEFSIHQNKGKSNAQVNNAATLEFCAQTLGAVQEAWAGISRKFAEERAKEEAAKKKAADEAKERAEREAFERKLAAEDKAREEAAKIEREIADRIAARPNPEAGLAMAAEKLGARKAKKIPPDAATPTPAQGA